ncbi:MAG: HpaII family restriction endonuclease [Bacteroidales bacterium]|nr:HpaII family restriction endonuclease [Bacteroidales bacterium]
MLSGNIGEWCEVYAFLKIMETGELQSADEHMEPLEDARLPVFYVAREEEPGHQINYYTINTGDERALKVYEDDKLVKECSVAEYKSQAEGLFSGFSEANERGKTSGLQFDAVEDFLNDIKIYKIKAPSEEISKNFGGKVDITMSIQQPDGQRAEAGFSIKSSVGSVASLGNASDATGFIYELEGCNDEMMDQINSITGGKKVQKRVKAINDLGLVVKNAGVSDETYKANLQLIALDMQEILSESLWLGYSIAAEGTMQPCNSVLPGLAERNPSNALKPELYYRKRLKDYLFHVACGLNPTSKDWDGSCCIKGGYIFVTKEGDLLAFYAADQDRFANWLLASVRFETPSTSRHKCRLDGEPHELSAVFKQNGKYYFSLSLQLRFIR